MDEHLLNKLVDVENKYSNDERLFRDEVGSLLLREPEFLVAAAQRVNDTLDHFATLHTPIDSDSPLDTDVVEVSDHDARFAHELPTFTENDVYTYLVNAREAFPRESDFALSPEREGDRQRLQDALDVLRGVLITEWTEQRSEHNVWEDVPDNMFWMASQEWYENAEKLLENNPFEWEGSARGYRCATNNRATVRNLNTPTVLSYGWDCLSEAWGHDRQGVWMGDYSTKYPKTKALERV